MFDFGFYILILSYIVSLVSGFPSGAPERACFFMIPRHTHPHTGRPVFTQHTLSPYNISVDRTTFSSDRPVRVTISGAPFKGFFLVAAEEGSKDWPAGQFYSENDQAKTLSCAGQNDGITHTSDRWKDSITVLWYGPIYSTADMIQFKATVVTNRTTFWTDVTSTRMTANQAGGEQSEGGPLTGALMRGLMRPGFDAWGYPINDGLGMGGGMNGMGGGMNGMGGGMNNMGFGMGGRGTQGGSGGEGGSGGSGGENAAGESKSTAEGSSFGGGRFGGGFNRGGWGNPFANMFGGGGFFWRRK